MEGRHQHGLKPSTVLRRETCIRNLTPFFKGVTVCHIQPHHCERWLTERGVKMAPQTMVHEIDTMRLIFDYAVRIGLMLANPAKDIKRRKIIAKPIEVPTREQFRKLIEAIRISDGRLDSQRKAKPGADLVELLAYSGCRIQEATSLTWSNVDLDRNALTITGGEIGTKNHEHRTIPMTDALRSLLLRLREETNPKPSDKIALIHDAKKCLSTASRRLGYPRFTHHHFGISSRRPALNPEWIFPPSANGSATRTAAPWQCEFTVTYARSTVSQWSSAWSFRTSSGFLI